MCFSPCIAIQTRDMIQTVVDIEVMIPEEPDKSDIKLACDMNR